LRAERTRCIWTKSLPEVVYFPVAHGEGKFVVKDRTCLARLKKNGQIVMRYCGRDGRRTGYPANPNGSLDDIAGICDETGRIFGLMPHPERHAYYQQHPRWTSPDNKRRAGDGMAIFKNGVEYIQKHF